MEKQNKDVHHWDIYCAITVKWSGTVETEELL